MLSQRFARSCHCAFYVYKTRLACFRCRKAFKRQEVVQRMTTSGTAWLPARGRGPLVIPPGI